MSKSDAGYSSSETTQTTYIQNEVSNFILGQSYNGVSARIHGNNPTLAIEATFDDLISRFCPSGSAEINDLLIIAPEHIFHNISDNRWLLPKSPHIRHIDLACISQTPWAPEDWDALTRESITNMVIAKCLQEKLDSGELIIKENVLIRNDETPLTIPRVLLIE